MKKRTITFISLSAKNQFLIGRGGGVKTPSPMLMTNDIMIQQILWTEIDMMKELIEDKKLWIFLPNLSWNLSMRC